MARAMLAGEVGLIAGARELSRLAFYAVNDWRVDEDFCPIGALDSETDHLPVGVPRQFWDPAALAEKDVEIARFEAAAREDRHRAGRSIVSRFGAA